MIHTKYRGAAGAISVAVLAVLLTLLLFVQMPSAAEASENHLGIDLTIHADRGDDVSVLGVEVFIDAEDAGDVSVAGAEVRYDGSARGDVSLAAAEATVAGSIGGDLSAAAAEIEVSADVAGEVSLAGADVRFTGSAGSADIAGDEVFIDGTINGTLRVGAHDLEITPGTVITGDFEFRGPDEPNLPDDLTIGGSYTYTYTDFDDVFEGELPEMLFPVVAIAGLGLAVSLLFLLPFAVLIGGGVLLLMMTGLTARTIDGIRERPFSSIGMGVVVLFGLLAIAVLLCITVIGIPLALAIFWFYPVLILIGFIIATLGVPYMVLRKDPRDTGAGAKLGIFFVSILALAVLFALPLIGQVLLTLIVLMGVGAFGAALLGGRNEQAA